MGHRLGHPPYRYVHPGYRYGIIWVIEMGDDGIDSDILGVDMGYLDTLPTGGEDGGEQRDQQARGGERAARRSGHAGVVAAGGLSQSKREAGGGIRLDINGTKYGVENETE